MSCQVKHSKLCTSSDESDNNNSVVLNKVSWNNITIEVKISVTFSCAGTVQTCGDKTKEKTFLEDVSLV